MPQLVESSRYEPELFRILSYRIALKVNQAIRGTTTHLALRKEEACLVFCPSYSINKKFMSISQDYL